MQIMAIAILQKREHAFRCAARIGVQSSGGLRLQRESLRFKRADHSGQDSEGIVAHQAQGAQLISDSDKLVAENPLDSGNVEPKIASVERISASAVDLVQLFVKP